MKQDKGQGKGRLFAVEIKAVTAIDLEERPQRKDAKDQAGPEPDAYLFAVGSCT